MTDLFGRKGSVRANRRLYACWRCWAWRAVFVYSPMTDGEHRRLALRGWGRSNTYFLTQCRVVWTYVRLFVLPFGQNADPEVAISHSLLDGDAIFGLLAFAAVAGLAWFSASAYRWPASASSCSCY